MITGRAVSALLLHHYRRVVVRRAVNYDFAGALAMPRSEVLAGDPKNHFIPIEQIAGLVLRKRWHGHSLTIVTRDHPSGRKYSWKPALNNFDRVCSMLEAKFGESLAVE